MLANLENPQAEKSDDWEGEMSEKQPSKKTDQTAEAQPFEDSK